MEDRQAVEKALPMFHKTGSLERFFKGWQETDYYSEFGATLAWVIWLSALMVVIVTLAGILIGANTMYTAVMNRIREIATYRVLGFSKFDILVSFLIESAILALTGGMVGLALGAVINGLPISLSQGTFYLLIDKEVAALAIVMSLIMGTVGGFFPALKALRMTVIDGLRHG